MNQTAIDFEGIRNTIRRFPVPDRLELISDFFVSEVACIGYELAHEAGAQAVNSVFVLASDTDSRVNRILVALESEVNLEAPITSRSTNAVSAGRIASQQIENKCLPKNTGGQKAATCIEVSSSAD